MLRTEGGRGEAPKEIFVRGNWRASVASETLTGVTQSKIGDVSLFSERAKRVKLTISRVQLRFQIYTSDVLEHKWRASLKIILLLYE